MTGNSEKIGFVGAGNMAAALIGGLLESGVYAPGQMLASDKVSERRAEISRRFKLQCSTSNTQVVQESRTVVLCVKPQNMQEVLEEVRAEIMPDHLLISIAAGIPLTLIRDTIRQEIPMIRVMPNTPALVGRGVSALAPGDAATEEHVGLAKKIFETVGDTVQVDEGMMDAVTAVSGSGPGYVFRIMEGMVEAAAAVGLERDVALRLVLNTFLGAAHLAVETNKPLETLREQVTSPGGTTAAGLAVLQDAGLDEMIRKTIEAARDRSIELGKQR